MDRLRSPDRQENSRSGKVKIIAPVDFMDHAVAENVYAGNAMNRRLFYQYGVLLLRSPFDHVDQSIGKNTTAGNLGLIPPNVIIEKDIEELTVDGVRMIIQNTPGTEAPVEMNTYFPDLKVFWAAENIVGTIHNTYTLRGALVRDALEWSKQINRALYLFGQEAKVLLADVFEQIGYQPESPSVRNSFLAAALEPRSGIPEGASPEASGPDMIRAMTTGLLLDFLGIRLDSKKAPGQAVYYQPDHAGQQREVRRRAEQRHLDQHRGLPGQGR